MESTAAAGEWRRCLPSYPRCQRAVYASPAALDHSPAIGDQYRIIFRTCKDRFADRLPRRTFRQSKFIYDVWGDAVNVAARMESAGAAGRINLSEAVMSRVKSLFNFDDRGTVDVKNKGRLRMYYLTRIKPALSRDELGHAPNEAFHRESAKLFPGYVAAA